MAAIAAELKVKANLRETADAARLSMVNYVLSNTREVTVTAADGRFDTFMKAAQDRSLREDDPKLFKEVKRLFSLRNGIAHRGVVPTEAQAQEAVRAARLAINWLDR